MKISVIGSHGFIGSWLVGALSQAGHDVLPVNRQMLDFLDLPADCPPALQAEVAYICAAKTRFIECEDDATAYRINVDAPVHIARWQRVVYLSSEAVERAIHTAYGMHKALAEASLRGHVIARLGRVQPETLDAACAFLVGLANARPGVYRWSK